MTQISRICPECAKAGIYQFGEHIADKRLMWWASFHCEACDYATESDDLGRLPQELRLLVIVETGLWGLELHSKDSLSMKAIHQTMQISLKELAKLKGKIPTIIFEGTETEARYYQNCILSVAPTALLIMKKLKS